MRWAVMVTVAGLVLAGCTQPDRPQDAQEWTPLGCDPEPVDWIGPALRRRGPWLNASLGAHAITDAFGQSLGGYRHAPLADAALHEWEVHKDGRYLGQLQARPLIGGGWIFGSEAGLPGRDPGEVEAAIRQALAGVPIIIDIEGDADYLLVHAYEALQGKPVLDVDADMRLVEAFHVGANVTEATLRSPYALGDVDVSFPVDKARQKALEFMTCSTGRTYVMAGEAFAVRHGALAHAIGLRVPDTDLQCTPPVLVDAQSGAVLGQAKPSRCGVPQVGAR